jgi:ABC-type multidrug transport system fused ATPase/permease subunit
MAEITNISTLKHILYGILKILNHREKTKLARLILSDLIIAVLDIAFLGLTLVIINFYTGSLTRLYIPFLPDGLTGQQSIWFMGLFCCLFGLKNWLGYLNSKFQHDFFYNISSRLSKRNIQSYLEGDYARFVHTDSSVYIHRISQQPVEFSHYILTNFQQVISQTILILFTISAILFYHPGLFFLLFLLLIPPVMLLAHLIRKRLRVIRTSTKTTSQKTIQYLKESLSGFIESNIYDKGCFFTDRYYRQQQQLNKNIATQQTLQGLTSRLIEVFAIFGFFILVLINRLSTGTPVVSMLTISVFMAASYKIIPGIVKILNSTGQLKTYEFTINDLLPANHTIAAKGHGQEERIRSLVFSGVDFTYKNQSVLDNISFSIQQGEFVAISGASGKGKTTIINLLLGFLEQDRGRILINDKECDLVKRKSYWNKISYVSQQSFMINDTILKNITLADRNYDQIKLAEVISFCEIHHITDQHPEGAQTNIRENGKNISGGQRQRIMLARALYHDFDLLILDEPFSEMDETSEKTMLEKLKKLTRQGKMIILITHNLSSLDCCDHVITLDKTYA